MLIHISHLETRGKLFKDCEFFFSLDKFNFANKLWTDKIIRDVTYTIFTGKGFRAPVFFFFFLLYNNFIY